LAWSLLMHCYGALPGSKKFSTFFKKDLHMLGKSV